ncbi:MAG: hypothetical protein U1E78_06740 [Gammaproteobacteria bacterium]
MLGEVQMPQVDESDVLSVWQAPVDRPVTIEESKPHELDLGVPRDAGVDILKESLLAKPFNVASRAAYEDKVSTALQMATAQMVLNAHQHLPTLSRIRSIRESIEHYKNKINSSEVPQRITQELNDFYEWAQEEQYAHPKTLEKYLKDARLLLQNAIYYHQSEKIVLKLKGFLNNFNEMTQHYLPPEGKVLAEAVIKRMNDFIRWAEQGDVSQNSFDLQRTTLINTLYQQCRWHRLGGPYYVEEIYDAIYSMPPALESSITVEISQALELANTQLGRQDCLLDLVCKTFPNFMTLTLKATQGSVLSSSHLLESASIHESSTSNGSDLVSSIPPVVIPSPPPPPPPGLPLGRAFEDSLKIPMLIKRKPRIDSEPHLPLAPASSLSLDDEKGSRSPLKRALNRATSLQDAIVRLHQFLEEETEEAKVDRLSRLESSKKPIVEKEHQIKQALRSLRKATVHPKAALPPPEPELTEAEKTKQISTQQIQAFLFAQRQKEGNIHSDSDEEEAWSDDEAHASNLSEILGDEDTDELSADMNRLKITL